MSETIYAATHLEKRAQQDDYTHGCLPETTVITVSESVNITSPTLEGLVRKLFDHVAAAPCSVWFPDDSEEGTTDRLSWNQLEDANDGTPSTSQLESWKRGETKLYLCDYDWTIECRTVTGVPTAQFDTEGVEHHA